MDRIIIFPKTFLNAEYNRYIIGVYDTLPPNAEDTLTGLQTAWGRKYDGHITYRDFMHIPV